MPRPATKADLIAESEIEYAALEKLLADLTPEQMSAPGAMGEWAVKDVLAHLAEWQAMFFTWYEAGLRGETAPMPAPGYKWNQLPALNQAIYLRFRDLSADEALERFRSSHRRTLELVHMLSEEELTQPGRCAWAGKHPLCGFISSNCGSHYRWARTGLRKKKK